jgi:hypothetical protein
MELDIELEKLSPRKGDLIVVRVGDLGREVVEELCQLLADLHLPCHFAVLDQDITLYQLDDRDLRALGLARVTPTMPC